MAWKAKHRYARIAERKARLVVDMIRGMPCDEAVEVASSPTGGPPAWSTRC
jgi:ribosomal protein L22